MISGTPTTLGDYTFYIRATNPAGGVLAPMRIEVEKAAPQATLTADPFCAVYGQTSTLTRRLATPVTEPSPPRPSLPGSFLGSAKKCRSRPRR